MKVIKAKCGSEIKVSDEDYEELSKYRWSLSVSSGCKKYPRMGLPYAVTTINGKTARMHRLVMDAPKGVMVDHINRNSLDNRRENLRLCDNSLNMINSKDRDKPLPRNIHHHDKGKGRRSGYRVEFFRNKKRIIRRSFSRLEDAILFRDGALAVERTIYLEGKHHAVINEMGEAKTPHVATTTTEEDGK